MHQAYPRHVAWAKSLAQHGDQVALHEGEESITYAALAAEAAHRGSILGPVPRLILLPMSSTIDAITWYVAALQGGHPVIVCSDRDEEIRDLAERYDPDVLIRDGTVLERRPGSSHELHPNLALLLSTSGTTGSPRLVRLSQLNVQSNAESIAEYLEIEAGDVAITTLPLTYCYGLSVLHSHLLQGAAVVLTSLSVVDACFWDLVDRHGVTSIAGVPHTFELLEHSGFADRECTSLRYLTQAGGRMRPDQVTWFAELGRQRGFDLVVMYGQTEATARMAFLPPEHVLTRPGCIGVAIPGGELRLDTSVHDDPDVGELLYDGPNVMLGYASSPADLALGRTVGTLRTGDLARERDGMFEIVGRTARFAKLFGLRIDLDRLERQVELEAGPVAIAAADDQLVVASPDARDLEAVRALVQQVSGLPRHAVAVHPGMEIPRLPNGKIDYAALASSTTAPRRSTSGSFDSVADAIGVVLGRPVKDTDTFVSLGGDSLSYVEASIRVEQVLGCLPSGWHVTPVGELDRRPRRTRAMRSLELSSLLRALAILAIVGTHANLFTVAGGAHLLLMVAGFNVGRFLLTPGTSARTRRTALARAALRIAVPAVIWIGAVAIVTGMYPWRTVFLVNGLLGPTGWAEPEWHYWFLEVLVVILAGFAVATSIPALHRLDRRWPFWLPVAVSVIALLTRYDLVTLRGGDEIHRASVVLWLVALGWAASRAVTNRHRLVVSVLLAATVPGFFGDPVRDATVVVGGLALIWVSQVSVPRPVASGVGVVASASLYVYLTHWQVYPRWEDELPLLATVASFAVGIAVWRAASVVERRLPRAIAGLPERLAALKDDRRRGRGDLDVDLEAHGGRRADVPRPHAST